MIELYEKYKSLKIDGSYIGLERGEEIGDYFCTPIGAKVIGWDNGMHYCFIDGFDEMVFCVNPDTCCDYYVYPLAKNFYDFLSLIATTKNVNIMQQIIWWNKADYDNFMRNPNTIEWAENLETVAIINQIQTKLGVQPMENPFEYIKKVQKGFPYDEIRFTNEYYDTLGLERLDGTEPEGEGCNCEFRPAEIIGIYHSDESES